MIEQQGRITRLEGPMARVSCTQAVCRACEQGRGCGAGLFGRLLSSRQSSEFLLPNPRAIGADRRVVVGVRERQLLNGAARLYGRPLLGLFAGALLGASLSAWFGLNEDLAVLLGSLSGMALILSVQGRAGTDLQPVILRQESPD